MPVSSELRAATLGLCTAVTIGGVLYIGTLMGLWVISGRPAGPEQQALGVVVEIARRWRPRVFPRSALCEARTPSTNDVSRRPEQP